MQILKVSHAQVFSAEFTLEMLTELAVKACGMSAEQVAKAATQTLKNANAQVSKLPYPKLRTLIAQKLHDGQDYGDAYKSGEMEFEFECLPDLDMGNAGANKRGTGKRAPSSELKGKYTVVRNGVKCTKDTDPEKYSIWQHVWACNSFEEYFEKAPAKAVTKTGRIITAASEMRWAVKSGWIKPVAAE